ncbi:nucleoside hydrolase [Serratia liquefaciens]|uniref:nucleoside hydrolase n=1 Tax=Serratia liquefaciens TaxID=614 RepID=UPI0021B7A221|nr:nucleoside hydrolase [Serratia liquefaciens]
MIDTDTASDDAVALLMALRESTVEVVAITTVAGNCEIQQCTKNALVSINMAGTYKPPVYQGMTQPLMRRPYKSLHIHGENGMGDIELPDNTLWSEKIHAVDAIINLATELKSELEIVTLGPLTNLAMAVLKDPSLPEKIKHVYIMGGSGMTPGNITPLAEFNFFVDAEAANIVIQSGLPLTVVGWEIGMSEAFIGVNDINILNSIGPLGEFSVKCNRKLMEFNSKRTSKIGFDLPDPTTMAVALYPEIIEDSINAYTWVEYDSEPSYGHYVIDSTNLTGKKHNARVVTKIQSDYFKNKLFELLSTSYI